MAADPARRGRRNEPAAGSAPARASGDVAVGLDRVIHERMRLAILSALVSREDLTFNDLKALTGASDGNLSVHARRLEDAGYVICTKSFAGRMPRTEYRITPVGRRALHAYLDHMEALIRRVREV
jgi:DNA-binding HxlR family transcriptional regulator